MLVLCITKIVYFVLRVSERKTALVIMTLLFIIAGKLGKVSFQRKMTSWITPLIRPDKFRVQKGTKALLLFF
jgi:TctA family transporter